MPIQEMSVIMVERFKEITYEANPLARKHRRVWIEIPPCAVSSEDKERRLCEKRFQQIFFRVEGMKWGNGSDATHQRQ
jgi:hypothetical protein